jgi:AraC-like DNA-binding protein
MTIIFRSTDVPLHEREDVARSTFDQQVWPATVDLGDPATDDSVMHNWTFGQTSIFEANLTGMRVRRTARQVRTGPAEMLTIARQKQGRARHDQFDARRLVNSGELMIVDNNTPYDFYWSGLGGSQALYVPLEELALPRNVVAQAASRLPASPLYGLINAQITDLTEIGDAVGDSSAAQTLGDTTTDLARALIASAYDADYARGAMAEVLLPRIRGYVRQHLSDASLSPDSIALAHNISVRKLFRLCEDADFSLEQWIIGERLDGSRAELARAETQDISVAAIARRWGFTNPSFFSRRFRAAYDMTPRAWRELMTKEDAFDD